MHKKLKKFPFNAETFIFNRKLAFRNIAKIE